MSYTPIDWKDRIVEKPRTYYIQNNPDGTITLIPAPGTVVQEGTPVNAANLNHMEQGLVTHLAEKASESKLGHVKAKTKADGTLIIPISDETAALYGLTGEDATVDRVLLSLISASKYYGKYAQMSGAPARSTTGLIPFSVEDHDDFDAINLAESNTRIYPPDTATFVRFYAFLPYHQYTNDTWQIHKSGTPVFTFSKSAQTGMMVYSIPIPHTAGAYYELYYTFTGGSGMHAGALFGMEVLR